MKKYFRFILYILFIPLPWFLRRNLLCVFFGYKIDSTAHIGRLSIVTPDNLFMGRYSRIDHFSVIKGMHLLSIADYSLIGRGNWITGISSPESALIIKDHSAITHRHIIECINTITIGEFTTIGGWNSQIMTHSINIEESCQESRPISIGRYCFIGTDCVLLGGSTLPNYCVLGAKSLLNKQYSENYVIYGGVPARPLKSGISTYKYFSRTEGVVN